MIDEHGHLHLRSAEHLDPIWRLWDELPAQWRGPVLGPGIAELGLDHRERSGRTWI